MPQQTLTHTGTMTGYQPVGDEVRGDAHQPHAASGVSGPQWRVPFSGDQEPLGQPGQDAEQPGKPDLAPDGQSPAGDTGWLYSAHVEAPGPAYGGAAWNNGGGTLANTISGTGTRAIESGAEKVIAGIAEDVL